MRFNVITLAFALAAPIMAANVGFQQGQQDQPLQEFDEPTTSVAAVAATVAATTPAAVVTPAPTSAAAKTQAAAHTTALTTEASANHAASVAKTDTKQKTKTAGGTSSSNAAASATPTGSTGTGSTGSGGSAPAGGQLLYIVNKYGSQINIAEGLSGGPAAQGVPSSLAAGATATISVLPSWAGRFALNPTGVPATEQDSTKIEGAITSDNFWDISLVDGYTVPVTCTCGSDTTPFIGCNIDLYKQGVACPSPSGNSLCLNPARSLNDGPANSWFAPCENAAYVYPDNDIATQTCSGSKMTCCVGSACAAGKNQKTKRELNPVAKRWAIPRSVFEME